MQVTIIAIVLIALYTAYIIWSAIHKYVKAKKEGTSVGCYSCSAYKTENCDHNCTSEEEVNEMIRKAKETLKSRKSDSTDNTSL